MITVPAYAWDQQPNKPMSECAKDLPLGMPIVTRPNTTLICRSGYALQHDNAAKIAIWAGWTVTPEETVGCHPRDDAFVADQSLPKGQRAEPSDYSRSGYDKGHMVPDADLSWSKLSEQESFLMSNMSPQTPNLNRGPWKNLEVATRAWAWSRKSSLAVYSGNIYSMTPSKVIGKNSVAVPDRLFKIIIDTKSGEILAFILPQDVKIDDDFRLYQTSVAEIEAQTGTSFPVPTGADKRAVAKSTWGLDVGAQADAKKTSCKVK
jgi:endonuclease G